MIDANLDRSAGRIVDGLDEVTKLNAGNGHVQGVELSGSVQLTDLVSVFGAFAYQDSQVSTFPTSAPVLRDEVLSRLLPLNGFGGIRWENHDNSLWVEGIVTVFDDADKIFRAVCAGASGYVLKSAGIDRIGEAIRQVMDGGAPMTPEVAKKVLGAFSHIEPVLGRDSTEDYHLTDRERDILRLMADGLLKKEIADSLDISIHTVSSHMRHVYGKLHVSTNTGAVAKALREGII